MFRIPLRISNPAGGEEREIMVMPDTGSFYTHLPLFFVTLGLRQPSLSNLSWRDVHAWLRGASLSARAAIDGRSVTTIVAFGADDVEPLLWRVRS